MIEFVIDVVLLSFLVLLALTIARTKDLFSSVMLCGLYSLVSAVFFVTMDAVDVAFTEAAVGAGISSLLMLAALMVTSRFEKADSIQPKAALVVVFLTGGLLFYGLIDMPMFGDPNTPVQQQVSSYYIEESMEEIGIPNMVTSVLASYRGYDTFGETVVIFTAGIGVLALLGGPAVGIRKKRQHQDGDEAFPDHRILRVASKLLIPPIMLFALYVQFHGDFGPGGGFQAGVIFAAAIALYAMVFGLERAQRIFPMPVIRFISALGVLLYGSVGMVSMLSGEAFLDYDALAADPLSGQHMGIFLVELGVGVTVTAVIILLFFTFFERAMQSKGAK
ncbi:DUF4040 domain-containing protein [Ferrimonas marina]|uniref:Multisubunit sodium/proton antiporter, MrpB subunit n=1 Tax=Ferrimonas marina TaxID=299255 RepID=A0A1M5N849_9GAMM|nr:DUF4040 domain-containing protein [Ferrimonas marina]SHG85612.1 multisubunit sodium/proton antiporter, MrpB subunit [Ferrimonas marina]